VLARVKEVKEKELLWREWRLGAVCNPVLSEQRRKSLTQWDTDNLQSSQASFDYKETGNS